MYQMIVRDYTKKKITPKKLQQYVCICCGCDQKEIISIEKAEQETSNDYIVTIGG